MAESTMTMTGKLYRYKAPPLNTVLFDFSLHFLYFSAVFQANLSSKVMKILSSKDRAMQCFKYEQTLNNCSGCTFILVFLYIRHCLAQGAKQIYCGFDELLARPVIFPPQEDLSWLFFRFCILHRLIQCRSNQYGGSRIIRKHASGQYYYLVVEETNRASTVGQIHLSIQGRRKQ